MVPARIVLGAREAALSSTPVFDGHTVLAPVDMLDRLGASHVAASDGGTVTVISAAGKSGAIDAVVVNNVSMLPMDKVMALIGGESVWNEKSRTLRLLARVESVEFVDSTLKINCSFPVAYSVGAFADRLYVDIPGTKLATATNQVYVGTPLVNRVRLSQYTDTTTRVVLDLAKKSGCKVDSGTPASQILLTVGEDLPSPAITPQPKQSKSKGGPYTISRIRVDTVDQFGFDITMTTSGCATVSADYGVSPPQIVLHLGGGVLADSIKAAEGFDPLLKSVGVSQTGKEVRIALNLNRIMTYHVSTDPTAVTVHVQAPVGACGKLEGKLIAIDAGHGGKDAGARWKDVFEKDVNFKIASELAAALEKEGARAVLTRSGDYYIGLAARPEVAISQGADFFISAHCNANDFSNTASGIETYYHKDEPSPKALGYAIHAGVCTFTGMCDRRARSDTKLYSSGLAVLRRLSGTSIPGILLECGYINHDSDRGKLLDAGYRRKLVAGIVAGFKAYVEGTPIQ